MMYIEAILFCAAVILLAYLLFHIVFNEYPE